MKESTGRWSRVGWLRSKGGVSNFESPERFGLYRLKRHMPAITRKKSEKYTAGKGKVQTTTMDACQFGSQTLLGTGRERRDQVEKHAWREKGVHKIKKNLLTQKGMCFPGLFSPSPFLLLHGDRFLPRNARWQETGCMPKG